MITHIAERILESVPLRILTGIVTIVVVYAIVNM